MKLSEFLTPNLAAAMMNGFMGSYFSRADDTPATPGNLYEPPEDDGQVDGGFRDPGRGRKTALVAGGLGLAAAAAVLFARRRRD